MQAGAVPPGQFIEPKAENPGVPSYFCECHLPLHYRIWSNRTMSQSWPTRRSELSNTSITEVDDARKIPVFEDAYSRFYESLPSEERNMYTKTATITDLMAALSQVQEHVKQRQKQRIARSISKVTRIVQNFEQYFKAIDIMIQSDPKYAALIWGALRLILLVRFGSFIDSASSDHLACYQLLDVLR